MPRLEFLEDRTVPSTLTVMNSLDSGAGSLRDTITNAKSGDTIVFAPSLDGQTITLTSDQITISKNLYFEGPGASLLSISGNDTFRVFDISQGLSVTIDGLTITHGLARTAGGGGNENGGGGGAILNASSTLALANDVLSYNEADVHGGAISNLPGSALTVANSVFIGNRAEATDPTVFSEGGAIWNAEHGVTASVSGCTFMGNQAIGADGGVIQVGPGNIGPANGGAIHNEGFHGQPDTLIVDNSTFTGNQAIGGNGGSAGKSAGTYVLDIASGGGIANDDGGILVVSGSTFSYNQAIGGSNATAAGASGSGRIGHALGGALNTEGPTTITNSTFDHNQALGGNNNTGDSGVLIIGRGAGGAIASQSSGSSVTLTVSNSAFTDNEAVGGAGNTGGAIVGVGVGGGLENERVATATVTNSTFSGNQAIGGAGAAGGLGADGLGGAIANLWGATLTVSKCTLMRNQAVGGAGGVGGNGGNGFGGGLFNDGLSIFPGNAGTPAMLTVTGSTITANQATGGPVGSGGSAGQGIGGGVYFAAGGIVSLDDATVLALVGNLASTSNNDVFGVFTIC